MRTLAATLTFVLTAAAQSPLSMPFTANNGGSAGWQIFFDLTVLDPAGITITGFDVNCGSSTVGTPGIIEVRTGPSTYVGNTLTPSVWTLVATGAVVAQGNNLPSPTCFGTGLYFLPGSYGIAVRHLGVSLRYTNGTGTNQTGATAELLFSGGHVQSALFGGTQFTPRVWNGNIYYNIGPVPGTGCAYSWQFGTGCGAVGLAHTVGAPHVGANVDLAVANVENLVPLAILTVGDSAIDPGIPLDSIGAVGCFAFTNANLTSATMPVALPAGTGSLTLPIPANPQLLGLALTSQVVAFSAQTTLGLTTSNGVTWTVGN